MAVLQKQQKAGRSKRTESSATVERYQPAAAIETGGGFVAGEERERKRLAGDLHDGLGGMMAGIKINLSRLSPSKHEEVFAKDLPVIIGQPRQIDK